MGSKRPHGPAKSIVLSAKPTFLCRNAPCRHGKRCATPSSSVGANTEPLPQRPTERPLGRTLRRYRVRNTGTPVALTKRKSGGYCPGERVPGVGGAFRRSSPENG